MIGIMQMRGMIAAAGIIGASLLQAQTYSPTRIIDFQDDFIQEESIVARTTPAPPSTPTPGVTNPPPGILGYSPLVIVNNSGIDSSRIYFCAKGGLSGANSFQKPNLTTGICTLVSGSSANSADPTISVPLSQLPSAGYLAYYVYFLPLASQRCYLSIDSPLYMKISTNGDINDPSVTSSQDPNYYVLYQNFESTLAPNNTTGLELYANVSNVDYFSLPFTLGSYTYPSGAFYPTLDNLTQVGFPTSTTRASALTTISSGLTSGDTSSPAQWPRLVVPFYSNPYTVSSALTDLRILAAKNSISLGTSSVQFIGAATPQQFFASNYISYSAKGPVSMQSYLIAVWNYYLTHSLDVTVFPGSPNPNSTYTMTATGTMMSPNLHFVSTTPGAMTPIDVPLQYLTTEALLSGAVGEWVFNPSGTGPFQTELSKFLSSMFTVGFLPHPSFLAQPILNEDTYFANYVGHYFNNPTNLGMNPPLNGPWYNLFDKVMHPLFIPSTVGTTTQTSYGLGYAYDYDDLLGIAGLLHVLTQSNPTTLNPAQPYVVLTMGSVDTSVPDTSVAFGPYNLTVGSLGAMSNPIDIIYSQSTTQGPNQTLSVAAMPQMISNLQNVFWVRYYTSGAKTSYNTYKVYPKYQLVLPQDINGVPSVRYNNQDAALMNGIVFQSANGTNFSISLPNTNPFPSP